MARHLNVDIDYAPVEKRVKERIKSKQDSGENTGQSTKVEEDNNQQGEGSNRREGGNSNE